MGLVRVVPSNANWSRGCNQRIPFPIESRLGDAHTPGSSPHIQLHTKSNEMKITILAILAIWYIKLAKANRPGGLDLKELGFKLWEEEDEGQKGVEPGQQEIMQQQEAVDVDKEQQQQVPVKPPRRMGADGKPEKKEGEDHQCPFKNLPTNVFFYKTFKHNGVQFTWVKPKYGLVNGVTCGRVDVWKGEVDELLLDLHFFLKEDGERLAHLEYRTRLGGVAHAYLKFDQGARPDPPKIMGMAPFLKTVGDMVGNKFLGVKGLPAFPLLHELAFQQNLGLVGLPPSTD